MSWHITVPSQQQVKCGLKFLMFSWFLRLLMISNSMFCLTNIIYLINSSPPSATYMRQWIGSALVQIMACLSSIRCQAIIWTNAGLLAIGSLGTNFSEILIKIQNFSFKKMHLKMSSAKVAAILSRGRWVNGPQYIMGSCSPALSACD